VSIEVTIVISIPACFLRLLTGGFHFLPQAERAHVSPHLFDVRQAFGFGPALARVLPAERIFFIGRPDRVLLLMIRDDLIDGGVFFLVQNGFSCCAL